MAVVLVLAAASQAAPNLIVGVADDYLKSQPERAAPAIHQLGLAAVRLRANWHPGASALQADEATGLQKAVGAAGVRIVVVVSWVSPSEVPRTPEAQDQFCSYARDVVTRFSQVNDIIVGNEPNTSWQPQFNPDGSSAAPGAYAALLARCYAVLHAAKPGITVVHAGLASRGNDRPNASSNVSHSPGNFLRQEAASLPAGSSVCSIFDVFALHAYGESSAELPSARHDASSTIALGDWEKLQQVFHDVCPPSARSASGEGGGPRIWVTEIGWQSQVDASKSSVYAGAETDPSPVPDGGPVAGRVTARADEGGIVTQGSQIENAVRLAYCEPNVEAIFNFLLRDDASLSGWQSGVLWADWTPKASFSALASVIAEVKSNSIDCSQVPGAPSGPFKAKEGVEVKRVEWPRASSFNWKNDLWRFRIQSGEDAAFTATLSRVGSSKRGARPSPAGLTVSGELRKLYFSIVKFPSRRLASGRYSISITLTSKESGSRTSTLRSPVFTVRPKKPR
jgi:hypothetical protein